MKGNRIVLVLALVLLVGITALLIFVDKDHSKVGLAPMPPGGHMAVQPAKAKESEADRIARRKSDGRIMPQMTDEELAELKKQAGNTITTQAQPPVAEQGPVDAEGDREVQLEKEDARRRTPHVFHLPRSGTKFTQIARRVQGKMTCTDALVEWYDLDRHPEMAEKLEALANQTFDGKAYYYWLVDVSGRPTTQEVLDEIHRQGGEPGNAADLFVYMAKVSGTRAFKVRVNAIGGEPIELPGEGFYWAYATWQSDSQYYTYPKDPGNRRPTWGVSFTTMNRSEKAGGWNFDKGKEQPSDPVDWFLAKKPVPPAPK